VDAAEWIAEARCWVLRNRARLTEDCFSGVGSVSSRVTVTLMLVSVAGGWGRPSSNRCEGFLSGWVVSLVEELARDR